jgi:hypothetical protein
LCRFPFGGKHIEVQGEYGPDMMKEQLSGEPDNRSAAEAPNPRIAIDVLTREGPRKVKNGEVIRTDFRENPEKEAPGEVLIVYDRDTDYHMMLFEKMAALAGLEKVRHPGKVAPGKCCIGVSESMSSETASRPGSEVMIFNFYHGKECELTFDIADTPKLLDVFRHRRRELPGGDKEESPGKGR